MNSFLARVLAESKRARERFPGQEATVSPSGWLSILTEEVGEVARELNEHLLGNRTDDEFVERVEEELVQVAAMAERMAVACRLQTGVEIKGFQS